MRGAFTIFITLIAAPTLWSGEWLHKIDQSLMRSSPQDFLVFLNAQADLTPARKIRGKTEKGTWAVQRLQATAASSQIPLVRELNAMGIDFQQFWVVNAVLVKSGDHALMENFAQREDVALIAGNQPMVIDAPVFDHRLKGAAGSGVAGSGAAGRGAGGGPTWNITLSGAPQVWAEGVTGTGAVIGGQDTGFQWDHPALLRQYRGWDGQSADHNHNWHDAIHQSGGICGSDSPFPCDDNSHGTHTMGIMAGDDELGNQIGLAPGARWIGCRNMDAGIGTPASYMECFQWFLAPTDLNGENPNPALAPHVINNSWSCPAFEGCTDPQILQTTVANVRAAGIVVVTSAGNKGPFCSTINEPPGVYDASFTVASTTELDLISSFSGRGPGLQDTQEIAKPDIAAPGSLITSSVLADGYGVKSGTSMAAPHVAGLVALLISAVPQLAGEVDLIEEIIRNTALPLTSGQDCGTFPGSAIPNAVFGYGRIRAVEAVAMARSLFQNQCSLYPSLLELWPGSLVSNGDVNANQTADIADLVALGDCTVQ